MTVSSDPNHSVNMKPRANRNVPLLFPQNHTKWDESVSAWCENRTLQNDQTWARQTQWTEPPEVRHPCGVENYLPRLCHHCWRLWALLGSFKSFHLSYYFDLLICSAAERLKIIWNIAWYYRYFNFFCQIAFLLLQRPASVLFQKLHNSTSFCMTVKHGKLAGHKWQKNRDGPHCRTCDPGGEVGSKFSSSHFIYLTTIWRVRFCSYQCKSTID